jgi:SET domain-containing protein
MFNHSCEPNVGLRAPRPSNEVAWLTLNHVQEGEELLISYIPTDMAFLERQNALKSGYGFECGCPKCAAGR